MKIFGPLFGALFGPLFGTSPLSNVPNADAASLAPKGVLTGALITQNSLSGTFMKRVA